MSNQRPVSASSSASRATRSVVIVGGGYGGTRLARALDDVAEVTLIERRDRFVHNVAAIRAVVDPSWLKRIVLPYDHLLSRGRVIHGEVAVVRSDGVTLTDGRILSADYIVLAPGSSYASPFKPAGAESHDTYSGRVLAAHDRLRAAGSIAIVGAGPVGIELAGEIKRGFPEKQVTLIAAGERLLPSYQGKLSRKLHSDLRALCVTLMFGRRVTNLPTAEAPYGPATPAFDDAPAIAADLVFPVSGASPNTGFLADMPGATLDHGRVVVDLHLNIPTMANVFVIGDAALTGDTMTVTALERQVPYLAKLLRHLLAGGQLTDRAPYKPWPAPVIVVPVGSERGATQLPLGLVAGGWLTSRLKGRALFVEKTRKELGL